MPSLQRGKKFDWLYEQWRQNPKRQEPDIPPKKPDIQPEPRPEEIPQDKDLPEQEVRPMQV
jgi:hypothetical protein